MADKIQRSYYLPPDLVQWLRLRAAKENRSQSAIVEGAIRALKNGADIGPTHVGEVIEQPGEWSSVDRIRGQS